MQQHPPELTIAARVVVRLVSATARLSRRRAWALSILFTAGTLLIDHLTGTVVSMSFLYMLSAAAAVWCVGERGGLLLAFLAVVISAVDRHFLMSGLVIRGHTIGLGTEAWNSFARLLSVTLVAAIAHGLHCALKLESWRASHDGLTGALNKAAFQREAGDLVRRARSQGRALVLAYMDLDGFKDVNDRHGHSAGDRVLRAFAEGAANAIRSSDLFARIGGDEFVVLMTVRACDEGDQVAEMLHGRLTAVLQDTGFRVTCSMGALVAPGADFDLDDGGLEMADMLMYEVKRSGKNALRIARGGSVEAQLRQAYPPSAGDDLAELIARIDQKDRENRMAGERRIMA